MPFVKTQTLQERLFSKIQINESTGCWEWTGAKAHGYGRIYLDGKVLPAHRVLYELAHGPIPLGLCGCHHCDNRACVNPDHLFLGTVADNHADMDAKGRRAYGDLVANKGTDHGRARLTEADVLEIRAALGVSQKSLARKFGIGATQVRRIRDREQWTHI